MLEKHLKQHICKLKTACSLSSDFGDILGTWKVQTSADKSQILNTVKQKYNLVFKK